MRTLFFLINILFFLFSCTQNQKKIDQDTSPDTLIVQNKRNINAIGVTLNTEAQNFVKDWVEYVQFDTFITRFYAISNSEALHNAKDLSKMAGKLKDSLHFDILQSESVVSRFNLLDSECKRFADMSTITAIKPAEVSAQIKKILEAYSGINAKLNSIFVIDLMESEIQLDPDFQAILKQLPEAENVNPQKTTMNQTQLNVNPAKNLPVKKKTELEKRKNLLKMKHKKKTELLQE